MLASPACSPCSRIACSRRGEVEVPAALAPPGGEVAQNMPETDDGATDFVLEGDTL